MPFARVGAMPQLAASSSQSSNNGRSSRSRSKGITMEDLKKQTAIRLAQEQKLGLVPSLQTNTSQPNSRQQNQQRSDHVNSSVVPQQQTVPPPPSLSSHHPSMNDNSMDPAIYGANQYQNSPHHLRQNHLRVATTSPIMPMYTSQAPQISYMMQHHQQHLSGGYVEAGRNQQTSPISMGHYSSSFPSSGYSHDSHLYSGPPLSSSSAVPQLQGPPLQPPSAYSSSDLNRVSVSTAAKAKLLPHGLTVHELKEMTKARLQAEAAERSDAERGVSPLDFEASGSGELRERAMSRDSTGPYNPVFVQPYTGAVHGEVNGVLVPNIVQVHDALRQSISSYGGRQFPSSPLPPGMQNVGHHHFMGAPDQSVDSIAYRTPARSDTWDSASVASFNSAALSENLGSDYVVDIGSGVTGNRARSFTYPAVQPLETTSPGLSGIARNSSSNPLPGYASHATLPAFDAAVGGNRRRAVTLSPNTGSILEDRPHHYGTEVGADQVRIPEFSTRRGGPMMQARQRNYSPVLEELGLTEGYGDNGSTNTGYGSPNPMVPLPPIPQGGTPGNIGNADLSSMQGKSMFLREAPATETRVPAPPGFMASGMNIPESSNRQTAFSRVGGIEDNSGSILDDGRKNQWDVVNVNRPHLGSVEDLASNLGSILNLSGSSRADRERANTYTYGSNQPSSFDRNPYISNGFIDKGLDPFPY